VRLDVLQGETTGWSYPVTDDEGDPADLTGWSLIGDVRECAGSPLLHRWASTGSEPNATVQTGIVNIFLDAATTQAWTWGWARFDLFLVKDDIRLMVDAGEVVVKKAITDE
jgi:hypothetical protein